MKRTLLLLLTSATLLLPTVRVSADEPAELQLEFVRKMREKGYASLALEYLEKLQKNPTPGLADVLPMELARTRVSLARQKEPASRAALFDEARKELEAFIAKNPKSPEIANARVEVARLVAYQGQALVSQAVRTEDAKESNALAAKAEAYFIQAGQELEAAGKALTKPEDRVQIDFERGKNFLDQAHTHPPDSTRAKLVGEAIKVLEKVEKDALEDNTNPALHLARGWLVKCYQEGDEPDKAARYFKALLRETVSEARPGQRWGWYFHIHFLPKDLKVKETPLGKARLIQKEALAWLKAFPSARNTPEGYAVRFDLATAYANEAQELNKGTKTGAKAGTKAAAVSKLAQKELASLAATDNDFAEKASQMNLALSFQVLGEKTPLSQLKDFEQCYLKARYEMYRMQDAGKKGGPEARQEHLKAAIAAFRRGLALADAKAPFQKLSEARFYLAYIYLLAGDLYRAAIVGEDLARSRPPTPRSAAAAGYALQAYADIAGATKRPGDRERLRDLAKYVLVDNATAWKGEPVTHVARFQLAMAALREKKYGEAIDYLEKITPDYSAYIYTQAQLILAANAARREAEDPKQKEAFKAKVIEALQRMPKLPDSADTATAQMYFAAQLEQGNLFYAGAFAFARKGDVASAVKKYAELDAFQTQLRQQYDKHSKRFPEEAQVDFGGAMRQMRNLARYGMAQAEYRAGEYDKVLAPSATGDVVAEVKKLGQAEKGAIKLRDYQLTGEILGLAMRADVQKGKIAEAKEVLALLRRLSGPDDAAEATSAGAVLKTLVLELKSQVRDLKAKQQTKQLDATVKNFSAFLDEMARQFSKNPSRDDLMFLAASYSSLEKYGEAAKLYAQIPEPKIAVKKTYTPEETKELQDYWLGQVNYGRALRLENRALRLEKQFVEARKVLQRIVDDPRGHGKFLAEKELLHMYEDQGLYGKGITSWGQFMNHPTMKAALKGMGGKAPDEQRKIKELYFDCFYHYVYCNFMYGKNHKLASKQKEYINRAAGKIVNLESSNPEAWELVGGDFRALLRAEPLLLAAFREQGGKEKIAPARVP